MKEKKYFKILIFLITLFLIIIGGIVIIIPISITINP